MRNIISWMSYGIFKGNLEDISFNEKLLVNTINQYSYCVAEEDEEFKSALIKSDVLLPDGVAIVFAIKKALGIKIKKIAGADIHAYLLKTCSKNNKSCFYLGSSEDTLKRLKEKLSVEYPELKVGFFSPPFKPVFSNTDNQSMIAAVNEFKPDVLFVGMTAPKQEKWATEFKAQLNAHIICTIGAVFDFYAGTVKRPHDIWVNLRLEWFIRLLKEPKRMWKRYLYYGPIFFIKIARSRYNKNII